MDDKFIGVGTGEVSVSSFKIVYDLVSECRKQIKGFRKYLRNCRFCFGLFEKV